MGGVNLWSDLYRTGSLLSRVGPRHGSDGRGRRNLSIWRRNRSDGPIVPSGCVIPSSTDLPSQAFILLSQLISFHPQLLHFVPSANPPRPKPKWRNIHENTRDKDPRRQGQEKRCQSLKNSYPAHTALPLKTYYNYLRRLFPFGFSCLSSGPDVSARK